jgi:hypothetical protein
VVGDNQLRQEVVEPTVPPWFRGQLSFLLDHRPEVFSALHDEPQLHHGSILAHLIHEGKLTIAGGKYNLASGRVDLMGASKKKRSSPAGEGH